MGNSVVASDSTQRRNVFEVLRRRVGYCSFPELINILTATQLGFTIVAEED